MAHGRVFVSNGVIVDWALAQRECWWGRHICTCSSPAAFSVAGQTTQQQFLSLRSCGLSLFASQLFVRIFHFAGMLGRGRSCGRGVGGGQEDMPFHGVYWFPLSRIELSLAALPLPGWGQTPLIFEGQASEWPWRSCHMSNFYSVSCI